jgi:hypothetical protein
MGILDRFKKKEDNFDNLPYLPDDPALPPLPPQGRQMAIPKAPALPPMPPKHLLSKPNFGAQDLPPLPELDNDLPPLPKAINDNTAIPKPMPMLKEMRDLPPLENRPMPGIPKPTSGNRAKVFVQLNKYKDIVSTVNKMETQIDGLQASINQIKDIRSKESEIINSWNTLLHEAKSKIEEVNRKLPKADEY